MAMPHIGTVLLYIALVFSIWAVILVLQSKSGARRAAILSVIAVTSVTAVLVRAFLSNDFSLAYVANHSDRQLPLIYKISALWAGQEGSLLLWLLILSGLAVIIHSLPRYRTHRLDLKLSIVVHAVRIFFLMLLLFVTSPFRTLEYVPSNGSGLNPMLQSIGMVVHPPILFLGFSCFLVPFAIVIVKLICRSKSMPWLELSQPWVLFAWTMLTAGIVTGGQWAYTELGWGGYWAWDPVENASLFPWLTATALLHGYVLPPGKQKNLWCSTLIVATFVLTIFGTFLTRSGILDSVHAFTGGLLGWFFLGFLVLLIGFSGYLLIMRRRLLVDETVLSTDAYCWTGKGRMITFSNVILLLILIGVLLGTLAPLLTRLLLSREIALDQGYYNQVAVPLFLVMIVLMGFAPVLDWSGASWRQVGQRLAVPVTAALITLITALIHLEHSLMGLILAIGTFAGCTHLQGFYLYVAENIHDRQPGFLRRLVRRAGAYLAHLGIVVIMVGVAGSSLFNQEVYVTAAAGDSIAIGGYRLEYSGLDVKWGNFDYQVSTTLQVSDAKQHRGEVTVTKTFGQDLRQPATDIGIFSTFREDLYVNLAGWDHEHAQVHVQLFPLVRWIWTGAGLIYLGMVAVMLSQARLWWGKDRSR